MSDVSKIIRKKIILIRILLTVFFSYLFDLKINDKDIYKRHQY